RRSSHRRYISQGGEIEDACEAFHKTVVCTAVCEGHGECTCVMEASMHGPFDKSSKGEPNIYQSWSIKLVALPLLLAIALIGYVVSHPHVVRWVADGVQAELADIGIGPDGVLPKRGAQPSNQARAITER